MPCTRGCCPTPRDHWLGVSIAAAATPTRRPDTAATEATESRWGRDMDAYKRLRRDGVQPKQIDGSARVEAGSHDRFEVEMGHLFSSDEERRRARQGMADAQDLIAGQP